jgi:hypothetical protein
MKILELWRYPVKSMGGERLQRADIGARGVAGDRGWALRDEKAGEIRGAKKLPALLRCAARYLEEPRGGDVPHAEMTLPDGTRLRTDDAGAAEALSSLVGRPLTLWPLQPAEAKDHYRRGTPDDPDMLAELREIFGRTEEEPLPDLSVFPPEIMEFSSPLGTYFDAFDVHLLTTATLARLESLQPAARFDVRRFRPNIVVDTPELSGFAENDWCGRVVRLGGARLRAIVPCVRCVMTTLPQGELPKDPAVLRTIVRDAGQNAGLYLGVETPGEVRVGDEVAIE